MRRLHLFVPAAVWLAAVCAAPVHASAAPVRNVGYFGGAGDEVVTGGDFLADGSIVIAGTSSSAALTPTDTRLEAGDGFVGIWNPDATQLVRAWRLAPVSKLVQREGGQLVVATGNFVKTLKPDGSSITMTSADAGGSISALVATASGYLAIANKALVGFDLDGKIRFRTPVNKSRVSALAADATYAYVAGDENTQTGFEPYRSPYVFRYRISDGQVDAGWKLYNWAGPDVRANGKSLQADSFVNAMTVDPAGQLWLAAGSDGGNTVLTKSAGNLDINQAALDGACYSGPCFNYKGARKTGMFARVKRDAAELERASWVIPYLSPKDGRNSPACGCKAPPANPNSATIIALGFGADAVAAAAESTYRPPESDNAWFRDTVYTGGNSWLGLFDRELKSIAMATMIPGTKGPAGVVVRGGRLLMFGEATPGSKPANLNAGEEAWAYALPVTANAAQKAFGGGKSDGYLLLACIGGDAECNAPPGGPPGTPPGTTSNGAASNGAASSGDAGCGCHVQSASVGAGAAWLAALASLVAWRRRKSV